MIIHGNKNYIFGDNNFTKTDDINRNYVFGDKNEINGNNNFIEGSGNIINNSYNKIFGSLNEINGNLNNINGIFNKIIGNNNFSIQSSKFENYFSYETLFIFLMKKLYGTQYDEQFGSSVAVDDNYLYVGSPGYDSNGLDDNGKLTIFNKSNYTIIHELYGTRNDEDFGSAVAVDDNYIYVGDSGFNSDGMYYNGKLTIYDKSDYNIVHELYGTQNHDYFGSSVAIDDNYIFVGSTGANSNGLNDNGKLTIINKSNYTIVNELYGTQNYEKFGSSVAVDDNYIYVGRYRFNSNGLYISGKLTIFNKSDYSIVHELYGTKEYEHFGYSVAVDDNYIYVGSPWFNSGGLSDNGKLTLYNKSDYSIVHELYGTQYSEEFGSSVAVDDNYIYVGSSQFNSDELTDNGKLTIFTK